MKQIIKKGKKTIRKNINIRSTKKTHTFILKPDTNSATIWQKSLELDLMTVYIYICNRYGCNCYLLQGYICNYKALSRGCYFKETEGLKSSNEMIP